MCGGIHKPPSIPKLDPLDRIAMAKPVSIWPEQTQAKSTELHSLLKIGDRDWHRLKSQSNRRAAELLAAALVQLIQEGNPDDVAALTKQALGWIKGDLKDPGCPRH
jgi:DnaJ-domain-containing protein 1